MTISLPVCCASDTAQLTCFHDFARAPLCVDAVRNFEFFFIPIDTIVAPYVTMA